MRCQPIKTILGNKIVFTNQIQQKPQQPLQIIDIGKPQTDTFTKSEIPNPKTGGVL